MSTRSRNRSDLSAARPPLVGRLHAMATTRHLAARDDGGVVSVAATKTRARGGSKTSRPASRTIDDLLTDFGTTMPRKAAPAAEPPAEKLFPGSVKPSGVRRMGHGWAPTLPPLAGYQMTSEQTPVLWPLIAGDGLPPSGRQMGFDVLSGGNVLLRPDGLGASTTPSRSPTPTSSSSASPAAASPHWSRRSCSG